MIPYARQSIEQEDIDAVCEVLRSDFLTQGPVVTQFESRLTELVEATHAVAFNSATSALHAACLSLGVGPGDSVWTSAISFVASANCALYCGGEVDFVDIEPDTFNMSVSALSDKLALAESAGRLPKVVIPVHMAGQSCDMAGIGVLADRYGFKIIEDASHAVGGRYRNDPIGRCRHSDITVFSFHPVKIITSGEGGMAVTGSEELARRLRLYCSQGVTRDPGQMRRAPEGPWYYEQIALGFNYRMTEIQAALGLSQSNRLEDFIARRNELANRYDHLLADLPLDSPVVRCDRLSAFHLYIIRLRKPAERARVFEALRANGVLANVHYAPIYTQPYYRDLGFEDGLCPVAEAYYHSAISLPLYPAMRNEDQDQVAKQLERALA